MNPRYVCAALIDGAARYFLWESAEHSDDDRVVLDDNGFIVLYPDEMTARRISGSSEKSSTYDLDAIEAWCRSSSTEADCSALLNAWNLFGDLPRSELYAEADAHAHDVYSKLFAGCNLPAITPPNHFYLPQWTDSEAATLKRVLSLGLAEFRSRLRTDG